jgi:hypothetical protein
MHNRVKTSESLTWLLSRLKELRNSHQALSLTKHDASHLMTHLPGLPSSLRQTCQEAFEFLLDFIEAPPKPPRIHQLKKPLAFLLTRFCKDRNMPASEARILVVMSRLLIRAITRSSGPPTPISRPQYPLYYFLLAFPSNLAFQYFGPMFHDRILAAPSEETTVNRSRKYDLSLHLERFLQFVPIPDIPPHTFVPNQNLHYIDDAITNFQSGGRGKKRNAPPSEDTVEHFTRTVRLAFKNQPRPPVDTRLSTRIADDDVMCGDLPGPSEKTLNDDDEESPDGIRTFHHSYESTRTSALQEGESAEEHSRLSPTAPEADLPVTNLLTWIRHRALARDARIHSSIAYWWEQPCPPLSIDAQLWHLAQSGQPEAAVAWLIKHTGLNADTALSLKFLRSNEVPSAGVFLNIDTNHMALRYVRPRDWCGYNSDHLLISLKGCEETTQDITIPLPPLVRKGLEPYLHRRLSDDCGLASAESADLVFLTHSKASATFSVAEVNRFLRHEITTSDSITLPSLSRAFRLMYEGRYGLNEVLSCYISGRVSYFLRAPLFYTRVRLADLTQQYWGASAQYAQALLQELMASRQASDAAITVLRTLVEEAPQPPEEIVSSSTAFGSKAVPRIDTITSFFQDYRNCLDDLAARTSLEDRRQYFNHFMIYSFLAFGYAIAIRPVSDANLRDHHVRHDSVGPDLVLVADKANQRYDDSRFIPLTGTAKALARQALRAREVFTAYLEHRWKPRYDHLAQKDWPIFFLLDSEFRIQLLTPKLIRQHLEDVGLGNRYRVPLNGNRHFFRSHLWPLLPARLLHAILGHQHQGREWMGRVSVSDLNKVRDLLTKEIDTMLEALGISPVTFTWHT